MKLNVNDLLQSLNKKQTKEESKPIAPKFVQTFLQDKNKKINIMSRKQEQQIRRKTNYQMTKQHMDQWIGVVKNNRQKQTLNFIPKDLNNVNVNFFQSNGVNDFQRKIQNQLKSMNLQNQKQVLNKQSAVLQKLDKQQAALRLQQARKHRTAIFYQQQKRRRISKIKSKLYHKIKKRQKQRQQIKDLQNMTTQQKNQYIQKLTKQRIKQRISGRHTTKSKHIQSLLRFNKNQRQTVQQSINEINSIRKKHLQKLNQQLVQQISQQYDDQNFRDQALKDLQAQIQALEGQQMVDQNNNDNLSDLKFIQNAKKRKLQQDKKQAYKLLRKLQKNKLNLKDVKQNNQDDSQNQVVQSSQQSESQNQNGAFRNQFGKKIQQTHQQKIKKGTIQSDINKYLSGFNSNSQNNQITQGLNIDPLKSKYLPQKVTLDLTQIIANNKQIYQGDNQVILQNLKQFNAQKYGQMQAEADNQLNSKKPVKGWGSWAGPGIKNKKVDQQQQLRKKIQKIKQIKNKRKDNSLSHVTINQTRNKNLSDYFVRQLPRDFSNPQQFNFMQNQPIGPQWNSFNQFKDNIKPKIQKKAGVVITPARLPRKMQKN